MEDQIQNLQNQVHSLQQKVIQLEHNQNTVTERNLNVVSKAPKSLKIDVSTLQQGDSTLKPNIGLNEHNFITLSQITEQEKIQILKTGFQLQAEGKISLKKYYESTLEHSLFQLKGYNIKYESIRRTKLSQNLKE